MKYLAYVDPMRALRALNVHYRDNNHLEPHFHVALLRVFAPDALTTSERARSD